MPHTLNRQQTSKGMEPNTKSWLAEAPLRNNLDPDAAENPNELVGYGGIGGNKPDSGAVANPNRETEAKRDGSDAVSNWPMFNIASGATLASLHHCGGMRMGFSRHAGMVIVCGDTDEAVARIARVLPHDPTTGVMRHAEAEYEIAIECAAAQALNLPMIAVMQGQSKA